ncbi:MAG: thiamine pyrophosphate-binding protein [Myxococcota bacterium]
MNLTWANIVIDELCALGCELFAIAPGSRSTPLVVAAAKHPRAQTIICHDERSLGFFALGYAGATGKLAAVIVTSGTAVANLFPAVVEASMESLPLVVLSADRPAELRGTTANQTIDQVKIFGNYARSFVDLPAPSKEAALDKIAFQVRQAGLRALGPLPGPIQINCQYREPLL